MTEPLAIIEDVVAGRYMAPELGGPLRSTIRRIEIAPTLDGREGELVQGLDLGPRIGIVCDERTLEPMGRRVARGLPGADLLVLEKPKADEATADLLEERARACDGLVAIGSGTINDLTKYVTHRTGRGCAVFATAPSMDGYVTSTVSITRDGFKLSLPAHTPRGVFFDLALLATAPKAMILAGFGDTVCRTTAQVDWLLSHLLFDTLYAETPYALMGADEPELFAAASGLATGAPDAMLLLTRMLVLSGLGVLVTGTSHCGSMGEHAISHYIDMLADPHPKTLHGQQVGIATWSMARLQAALLEPEAPPRLRPIAIADAELERRYGRFAPACRAAIGRKPWDAAGTARTEARLAEAWPAIRARLRSVMLPLSTLAQVIERAGMPARAEALGIDRTLYRDAVGHAHEIRDRYGFQDLAAQAGLLERFAAHET